MPPRFVDTWRRVLLPETSWVLFRHGTCVVITDDFAELRGRAIELMRDEGPVIAGSSFADFETVPLAAHLGWVVASHHEDILTLVTPDEVDGLDPGDLAIGLLGRTKRERDARELDVVHVEDRRELREG